MRQKYILLTIFLSISSILLSQSRIEHFFSVVDQGNYELAINLIAIDTINDTYNKSLKTHIKILLHSDFSNVKNNLSATIITEENALDYLNLGIKRFAADGDQIKAFETLRIGLELAKTLNNKVLICQYYRHILEMYERFHTALTDKSFNFFVTEYKEASYNAFHSKLAHLYEYRIYQRFNYQTPEKVNSMYRSYKNLLDQIDSPLFSAKRDLTYYVQHLEFTKNFDSAAFYSEKAVLSLKHKSGLFEKERYIASIINNASIQMNLGRPEICIKLLNSVEIDSSMAIMRSLEKFVHYRKHLAYKKLGDSLNQLKSYNEYLFAELLSKQSDNLQIISEYETKYQTAEKEKQILIEQEQKERNRNIAYGLGGGVVAVSLIGFLLFTNSRRKQRIAEQQSEIEIQKTEKILKEQELTTIDAMISGQEKERQRLASDLHDSVGATLAAAKLQFDHLSKNRDKPQEMEPLYDKTAQLLEDAYTEVRSLAHAKNSGVIAKNGLLPAVQQLARNASGTSKLNIEVEDFGLDERIENSLEISIFRMIQELVTNMIKHAEATSASISITQHEESLNIILEDNGKGFDPKKVITKDGMGLSSIERRIEHLEGSFEVDSTIGKGTTIIIDIPL